MVKRATVPAPAEAAEIPVGQPIAFGRGTGPGTLGTDYGQRLIFGAHAWIFDGTQADYLGHVNVFWSAVVGQLTEALKDPESVIVGVIVKEGRRYELRDLDSPQTVDRFYDAIEAAQAGPGAASSDN